MGMKCRWCGKSFSGGYNGYCSRRCYEKARVQDKANWEATKQKIRDSGGFFSWLFKTILKFIMWVLILFIVIAVFAISGS